MKALTVAMMSALAATTCVQAVPRYESRNNDQKDWHDDKDWHHDKSWRDDKNCGKEDKPNKDWQDDKGMKPYKNFTEFVGWDTFKGYGSNLGAWLETEKTLTPDLYASGGAPNATDEWTFCETVGFEQCGRTLEHHYATFITTDTIDKLATVEVNILRIPTTYAPWVYVPGSYLYRGNQLEYLRNITHYAITKYGMHIIIDLHSLPGGVNSLDIGEAFGHDDWFYNSTNFNYSLQAVESVLDFIEASVAPNQFTIAAINEPCDNITLFATPETLSPSGVAYVNKYVKAAYALIQARNPNLWLMQNDAFMFPSTWTPFWNPTDKWLVDVHLYFFENSGVYGNLLPGISCGEAAAIRPEGFNVFVGEFSLQTQYNNSLDRRQELYDSQVTAYRKYLNGGTFWTAIFDGFAPVSGQGTQNDYWYFIKLIDEGVVRPFSQVNMSYCEDTPIRA